MKCIQLSLVAVLVAGLVTPVFATQQAPSASAAASSSSVDRTMFDSLLQAANLPQAASTSAATPSSAAGDQKTEVEALLQLADLPQVASTSAVLSTSAASSAAVVADQTTGVDDLCLAVGLMQVSSTSAVLSTSSAASSTADTKGSKKAALAPKKGRKRSYESTKTSVSSVTPTRPKKRSKNSVKKKSEAPKTLLSQELAKSIKKIMTAVRNHDGRVSAADIGHICELVEHGADAYTKAGPWKSTAFHIVAAFGNCADVKCLLNAAKLSNWPDIVDGRECPSLATAIFYNGDDKVPYYLVERGANKNFRDKDGYTLAHYCLLDPNRVRSIRRLAHLRADLNGRDNEYGWTPLLWAVGDAHPSVAFVKALMKAGARVDITDPEGRTALHWLCSQEKIKASAVGAYKHMIHLLMDGAARNDFDLVNARDSVGTTALIYIAKAVNNKTAALELSKYLIEVHGADLKADALHDDGVRYTAADWANGNDDALFTYLREKEAKCASHSASSSSASSSSSSASSTMLSASSSSFSSSSSSASPRPSLSVAEQYYQQAVAAEKRGSPDDVWRCYLRAAKNGSKAACAKVGHCYLYGDASMCEQNLVLAYNYLQIAAESGDHDAALDLVVLDELQDTNRGDEAAQDDEDKEEIEQVSSSSTSFSSSSDDEDVLDWEDEEIEQASSSSTSFSSPSGDEDGLDWEDEENKQVSSSSTSSSSSSSSSASLYRN